MACELATGPCVSEGVFADVFANNLADAFAGVFAGVFTCAFSCFFAGVFASGLMVLSVLDLPGPSQCPLCCAAGLIPSLRPDGAPAEGRSPGFTLDAAAGCTLADAGSDPEPMLTGIALASRGACTPPLDETSPIAIAIFWSTVSSAMVQLVLQAYS